MVHLVYCDNTGKKAEKELDKIQTGSKTMFVRGAAGRKIPHSRVQIDDTLYFMEKGTKSINTKAKVTQVYNYAKLSDEQITSTLQQFQDKLQCSEKQLERWHKKCLCLVEFDQVEILASSLEFDHQGNMDDWLILNKIEDVIKGTSIPYNYDLSRF